MRPAGLEVDRRQDDFPIATHYFVGQPEPFVQSHAYDTKDVTPYLDKVVHDGKVFGLRKATHRSSLALAVVTIFRAVGVGIVGSSAGMNTG